jgi:ribonuclease Y
MKLISDGRIHPARIEDVVKKVGKEVDVTIKEAGEQAAFDLGVHGIHSELINHLGRLKFRTSYAQNVLQHSVEVGFLCGIMAAELGLNQKLAKRMGLLHDIGKAIDHEVEGPHAVIGSKLAKKFGESPKVVHAIAAHHEDVPPSTVYALLVQAADGLSGARPGCPQGAAGKLHQAARGSWKPLPIPSRGFQHLCHSGRQGAAGDRRERESPFQMKTPFCSAGISSKRSKNR